MSFDVRDLQGIPDPIDGRSLGPVPPARAAGAPGRTRGDLRRARLVALVVGVTWVVALVFLLGLRGDLAVTPVMLAHIGLPALLGGTTLGLALWPGRLGLGAHVVPTVIVALGGPIAFVALAAAFPATEDRSTLARGVFICGDIVLLLGAVPLAAVAWAQRRTAVTAAPWRSVLLGVAVGLAGAAALGMHCNIADGLHVALGHGWPIVALGIIGWGLVRRVTRV